jgi:hypothetical protein
VAAILDNADIEHFHQDPESSWTVLASITNMFEKAFSNLVDCPLRINF